MGAILTTGAVFLHIPKTGGTWIEHVLIQERLIKRLFIEKHANCERLNRLESIYWGRKPAAFCFVRHPLTWYESWYRYQCQPQFNWMHWSYKPHHPCAVLDGLGGYDFNEFISACIEHEPGFVSRMYRSFTSGCSFVGRQEYLADDLSRALLKTSGYRLKNYSCLPRANESTARPIAWDPELRDMMIEYEQDAIDQWYAE